jgi:hypothetical protein
MTFLVTDSSMKRLTTLAAMLIRFGAPLGMLVMGSI